MKPSASPGISIVILNYNRAAETRQTLESLKQLLQGREDIEVVAVDNASTDETLSYLKSQSDWVTVVALSENTGIGGLNKGFEVAGGRYIFVLDDDSCPVDAQTLDRAVRLMEEDDGIGAVACRIESPDGTPVMTWHLPKNGRPGPATAFVGCGFAIRRELFRRIGWFPAHFFLYQNEVAVSIELYARGFSVFYDPGCRVIHRESAIGRTYWRRVYFATRNTLWLIRRYYSGVEKYYLLASRLAISLFRAIQYKEVSRYQKAVRDAFAAEVPKAPLPADARSSLKRFWRQNSLFHQACRWL